MLVGGNTEPGNRRVIWDGQNASGHELSSGIYIARLVTAGYTHSIRMVLLK